MSDRQKHHSGANALHMLDAYEVGALEYNFYLKTYFCSFPLSVPLPSMPSITEPLESGGIWSVEKGGEVHNCF